MKRQPFKWQKLIPYAIGAGITFLIVAALRPQPIEVDVATVSVAPLSVTVREEAKTKVKNRYVITPPVNGFLNRIPLKAGSPIVKNETVLATLDQGLPHFLDPRTKQETQARLKAAHALQLQKQAEVDRAEASLELAKKEYERAQKLDQKNFISRKEWDEADAQVKILSQELSSAQFALSIADFEVEQLEAKLKETGEMSEGESKPLNLISPVDGYVLKVYEESSRFVSAGTPLMEIGNIEDLEVEIEMLSSDAVSIKPDAEVLITRWGGEKPLKGKVRLVEPGGYTKTSSLGVEEQRVNVHVELTEPLPKGYRLGDRFRVETEVIAWSSDNVLQVPTGALFRKGSSWMTFLVNNEKVALTKVEIGHNNGIDAEVISGLKEGDQVVVYPPDNLENGSPVSIKLKN